MLPSAMTSGQESKDLSNHLHRVADLVQRGDFARARKLLRDQEQGSDEVNRMRLGAVRSSLDVDRAAWVVFGVMAVVLIVIAIATLWH
jgi:hypothetical protein